MRQKKREKRRPSSLVSCRRSCAAHIHTQAQGKYLNLINYIYKHAAKAIKFATRTRRMLFALKLSVNQIEAPKVAKWNLYAAARCGALPSTA